MTSRTLEDFRLSGYKLIQCCCDHCGRTTMVRINELPMWTRPLNMEELAERLKCRKCGTRTRDAVPNDGKVQGVPRDMW